MPGNDVSEPSGPALCWRALFPAGRAERLQAHSKSERSLHVTRRAQRPEIFQPTVAYVSIGQHSVLVSILHRKCACALVTQMGVQRRPRKRSPSQGHVHGQREERARTGVTETDARKRGEQAIRERRNRGQRKRTREQGAPPPSTTGRM